MNVEVIHLLDTNITLPGRARDWIEAMSFLQDESTGVTHVLFVIRWAKPLMGSKFKWGSGMEKFRSVVDEVNIDDVIDKLPQR